MNAGAKYFLVKLCVTGIPALFALGIIQFVSDSTLPTDIQTNLIGALILPTTVCALVLIISNKTLDKLIQQATGYEQPPPPPKTPEQEKLIRFLLLVSIIGVFAGVLIFKVIPSVTHFNAVIVCILGLFALVGLGLTFYFDAFPDRYAGGWVGLLISLLFFSLPTDADWPTLVVVVALVAPPLTGHLIQKWWNAQDFVKDHRRKKQDAERMEELKRQQTEQAKQAEAAKQSIIDSVQPIASSPGARTREAEELRAQLDELLKK